MPCSVRYFIQMYTEEGTKYARTVSYTHLRNYIVKYEAGGVEALRDNRGKRKRPDEMSELEKDVYKRQQQDLHSVVFFFKSFYCIAQYQFYPMLSHFIMDHGCHIRVKRVHQLLRPLEDVYKRQIQLSMPSFISIIIVSG